MAVKRWTTVNGYEWAVLEQMCIRDRTHTGHFRLGGDVLLTDENGVSDISGADFALAFVDEIETPAHKGQRFTVAY